MSILETDKIFVEPADELPDVMDKILKSVKQRIILVIPSTSPLIGSILTMKILFYEISKNKKNIIIVTEDNYGFFLVQKIGFVVVKRLSQITNDLWEVSLERIFGSYKKLFSKDLQNDDKSDYISYDDDKYNNLSETLEEEHKTSQNNEKLEENEFFENNFADNETKEDLQLVNLDEIDYLKTSRRKRIEKLTYVDGIEIYGGGDIQKLYKEECDKISDSLSDDKNNMNYSQNSFVGKDLSSKVSRKGLKNLFPFLKKRKNNVNVDSQVKKNRTKLNLVFILLSIIFFLSGMFLLVYDSINVEIFITLRPETYKDLENQVIIGDLSITNVDLEKLKVPVAKFDIDKLGSSKNGKATGKSTIGTRAKGLVTIYNTTSPSTDINLPIGTKLKNLSTELEFVLVESVKISAPQVGSAGELLAGILEDVKVEAVDIGDKFNLKVSPGSTLKFTVNGYSNTQVSATAFISFEGGSSEEIVVVSQEDVDKLKEEILTTLRSEAITRLKNVTPQGFIFVENSLKISEQNLLSTPAIGEKVIDQNFTVDLEISASAYFARQDYINEISKYFLRKQKSENENLDVVGIKSSYLEILNEDLNKPQGSEIKLNLKTVGIFRAIVNQSEIINSIVGKKLDEAVQIIKSNSNVADVRIGYLPFFIPNDLRYIPTEFNKIKINIK